MPVQCSNNAKMIICEVDVNKSVRIDDNTHVQLLISYEIYSKSHVIFVSSIKVMNLALVQNNNAKYRRTTMPLRNCHSK